MLAGNTIEDWRAFGAPRFRTFHWLALTQGVVGVLVSFDVIIPFALAVGIPPFVAVLLGVLPLAGGMAQLAVPRMLDRTDGNLRGLTLFFASISEPRGLYMAALAVLVAAGVVTGPLLLAILFLIIAVSSFVSSIVGANLLSWYSAILPEQDRRLVVPRLLAVSLAIGAVGLLPIAVVLDALYHQVGPLAYALPFTISGLMGLAEIYVLHRLDNPGKFIVPAGAESADALPTPELSRFLRVSVINAFGMGLPPAMSVFAITVVGVTAGFSMMIASIGTLTQVVAAAVASGRLARGSSTTMLRQSFGIRVFAMVAPLLALPGTAFAPVFLIASSMLGAIGFAFGSLAANEKLFRLISGPAVVRQHARYLGQTSGAMTAAQIVGAAIIGIAGPLGYPCFAALYAGSAALRVVAFRGVTAAPRTKPSELPGATAETSPAIA